jgi:hypothetical protein
MLAATAAQRLVLEAAEDLLDAAVGDAHNVEGVSDTAGVVELRDSAARNDSARSVATIPRPASQSGQCCGPSNAARLRHRHRRRPPARREECAVALSGFTVEAATVRITG